MKTTGCFHSDGHAALRGALSTREVEGFRLALDEAIQQAQGCSPERQRQDIIFERGLPDQSRTGLSASEAGGQVFILGDLCRYSPRFLALLRNSRLTDACRRHLRSDVVVAHLMNATIKQPLSGRAIRWHRDFPNGYLCGPRSDFLRVMICLDGMVEAGGATRFIPGSHLVNDSVAIEEKRRGARSDLNEFDGVAAECTPGDVVFIHPKVIHGSPANRSNRIRRNIIVQVGVGTSDLVGPFESVTGFRLGPEGETGV